MSSIPSVTMNDGTSSLVLITPLMAPTAAPMPSISSITQAVADSSPSISRAAITTSAVTSDPTDRSKPPLTITKYWPIARIISGAARLSSARYPAGSLYAGPANASAISSTISTANTGAVALPMIRLVMPPCAA
jgi:hypothetical protein